MPERVYDKINYQTNFTSTKTFAILLRAIKKAGTVSSDYARDILFPQAKSAAGMSWNPSLPDTHGKITLEQYGLIEYVSETDFQLSYLGERFLELFDENFNQIANSDYNYVSTMIDTLLKWKDVKNSRSINVGYLIIKILLDDTLGGYITENDFIYISEYSNIKRDSNYIEIRDSLLQHRESGNEYPLKKANILFSAYAGTWKLMDKFDLGDQKAYKLTELAKRICLDRIKIIDITNVVEETKVLVLPNEDNRITGGCNVILYGVPGAGKSWTIENEYCVGCGGKERLVFHPDYTYADFVGQILPKVDIETGEVTYKFVAGPFTKIVKKAYENPDKEFFLIIEEINRGNAPAIFGDVFQLLDRDSNGQSSYGITHEDIARIIYGNENHEVRIPSNMSILATMNTSDQNVFTLDTAFQRRWHMRLIENVFKKDESEDVKKFADTKIMDTTVTWETFCTKLNEIILNRNVGMTSAEDKRLGTHFITAGDLVYIPNPSTKKAEIQNSRFAEKVIKYLWDDAFKFSRDEIFNAANNSLDKVIDSFMQAQANERFNIFVENIKNDLLVILENSKKDSE